MTQPTPPTSELLRELAATHGDVLEAMLRRGYFCDCGGRQCRDGDGWLVCERCGMSE